MIWPPIPTLVRGTGGTITVRCVKKVKHTDGTECWGEWDEAKRTIRIDKTAKPEHQWRVLFHELTHAALGDAGIENLFDPAGVETLCDALATARMQEFRGQLGIMDA
jgi:hypothetical protein